MKKEVLQNKNWSEISSDRQTIYWVKYLIDIYILINI
jgi:hypothetical protein